MMATHDEQRHNSKCSWARWISYILLTHDEED